MNKRILIAALLIAGAGFLYKRSAQSMSGSEGSSSSMFDLKSNSGKLFQVPGSTSQFSGLFKDLLSATGSIQPVDVPFDDSITQIMVTILNQLPNANNIDNLVIETLRANNQKSLVLLANLSDFLGITDLTRSIMRLYIFRFIEDFLVKRGEEELKKINKYYFTMKEELSQLEPDSIQRELLLSVESPHLREVIKKEFFFIRSSAGFKYVVKSLFHPKSTYFTWQDHDAITRRSFGNFDLKGLGVSNTYGLSLMEKRDEHSNVNLSYNNIQSIPAEAFKAFVNLEVLILSDNKMRSVSPGAFNGLKRLWYLEILKGNKLNLSVDQIKKMLDPTIQDTIMIR